MRRDGAGGTALSSPSMMATVRVLCGRGPGGGISSVGMERDTLRGCVTMGPMETLLAPKMKNGASGDQTL